MNIVKLRSWSWSIILVKFKIHGQKRQFIIMLEMIFTCQSYWKVSLFSWSRTFKHWKQISTWKFNFISILQFSFAGCVWLPLSDHVQLCVCCPGCHVASTGERWYIYKVKIGKFSCVWCFLFYIKVFTYPLL